MRDHSDKDLGPDNATERALPHVLDSKSPGTRIADRYVLHHVLGFGNTSIVYEATDEFTGRRTALKLIPAKRRSDHYSYKQIFEHAIEISNCNTDNIGHISNIGTCGDDLFVDMELVRGVSLRAHCQQTILSGEKISAESAVRIVLELLRGLKAAHENGLFGVDLKPSKILLTSDPKALEANLKILDLGVTARATNYNSYTTMMWYAAPEWRAKAEGATAATDLYTVSAIFYELLTFVLPIGKWQPASSGRRDVPRHIDELLYRGLSENASLRPQSVAEYRAAMVRPRGEQVGSANRKNVGRRVIAWLTHALTRK